MIFNEIYGAYYNAVAEILKLAVKGELDEERLKRAVEGKAFGESGLVIPSALKNERWQLLFKDYTTPIKHIPTMPLTLVQKMWLKAVSLDKRVKLFDFDFSFLDGVEPLYRPEDIVYYDRYSDGDDYSDEGYIARFKLILSAIKERHPIKLELESSRGRKMIENVIPEHLEYSEKDDKFRLITSGCRFVHMLNLSRIKWCRLYNGDGIDPEIVHKNKTKEVTLEVTELRNTLERAMLHFSNFEKRIEKSGEGIYTVHIFYDEGDETEILIRILSFGHTLRVVSPESFVNLIKTRLIKQKNCGLR